MEKHVERMISIVYRAHKIREESKDSENKGISPVEGEFYRSICHFARCNYIDTIFEFHKIEMERIFSNEKESDKERIDTRALFREALDIRFDVEDYPQISTLVPTNELFLNFPSYRRDTSEAELPLFPLSLFSFHVRIFEVKFYRLNTDHCRDIISVNEANREKIPFETAHPSSPENSFFFRDLTRSIKPIMSRKNC